MVERQIVDLVVVGSNPIDHPLRLVFALVAQLDRATDFESVGRTFESCRAQRNVCCILYLKNECFCKVKTSLLIFNKRSGVNRCASDVSK